MSDGFQDPNASHELGGAAASPFGIKLLVMFLSIDASERLLELILYLVGRPGLPADAVNPYLQNPPIDAAWILVNLFFVLLLLLRARAGRRGLQAILFLHVCYVWHVLAIRHPDIWLYLTELGRTRIGLTVTLDVFGIAYLFSHQARSYLNR